MQTNNELMIPRNMRRVMDSRGLSAQRLSYRAEVSAARISDILRGKTRNPGVEVMCRIARALDVTLDDLVGDHVSDDSRVTVD